jgi:hypothetical protein
MIQQVMIVISFLFNSSPGEGNTTDNIKKSKESNAKRKVISKDKKK